MLWSGPDRKLGQILPAPDDTPGRRPTARSQSEQGLKRGHGCLTPVVPKDELVQIDLQVMAAHTMVGPDEPLLQVANHSMDARQDRPSSGADLLRAHDVVVACRLQATELFQSVGGDGRPMGDVPCGEVGQRGLAEIWDDSHPGTSRSGPPLFDSHGHERRFPAFQLPTPAQPRLRPSNPRVVEFDLPCKGSRAALTMARRSLCRIRQAVSYRRMPNCRWSSSAEIPRLSVVIKYAAQNHTVSGVFVRWKTVPAVNDTW